MRSFRDLYAAPIFAASLHVAAPQPYVFLLADLPGSILACLALVLINRVHDNVRAMRRMLQSIVLGALWLALCTALFSFGLADGLVWQMMLGVGIFVPYTLYSTPFFDRLFAAAQAEGTATYLVFLADFCGYLVTIGLLLLQNFGTGGGGGGGGGSADAAATMLHWYTWLLYGGTTIIGTLTVGAIVYFSAALAAVDRRNGGDQGDARPPLHGPCEM